LFIIFVCFVENIDNKTDGVKVDTMENGLNMTDKATPISPLVTKTPEEGCVF